ncbi:MAG: aminopeptidase P family protein [Pseudomonadota bacterium]
MSIKRRIAQLRAHLEHNSLQAFIVPRSDEYLGEYVPAHNERLAFISGFTGSAGLAIVARESAAIFVDGRYTVQVRSQAPAEIFEYCHSVTQETSTWISEHLPAGARVGIDPKTISAREFQKMTQALAPHKITLVDVDPNPIDTIWTDRPLPAVSQVRLMPARLTGEDSKSKRTRIGLALDKAGANAHLVFQLDNIAWLLNIRGADVPHLPVLQGAAILHVDGQLELFTDPRKLPNGFPAHVGDDVRVIEESKLRQHLESLPAGTRLLIDEMNTNAFCLGAAAKGKAEVVTGEDPVQPIKACKNTAELTGMRSCHIRDGAAVSRFLHWLHGEVNAGRFHNEADLADRLEQFRSSDADLADSSFDTISAAGANAAMPHYRHTNGTPAVTAPGMLYLVDSGGQYLDGTTDITRTEAIGEPTSEQREMFTRVLKGHIALARAVFPKGTTGVQLDALARQFLWAVGRDYDHGTGHGVGCFLSVHEGPQRIGKTSIRSCDLRPGMVLSNEPGYYKAGEYGIRCENLMVVVEREDGYLAFETITFAPFDHRLIDRSLLTQEEAAWLNHYHAEVRDKLSPHLEPRVREWLLDVTPVLTV